MHVFEIQGIEIAAPRDQVFAFLREPALQISSELFRKRLQHARAAIESFTRAYCGLVSDAAACACHRRVPAALRLGRARADVLEFAATASSYQEARAFVRRVERARWAVNLHRSSHPRASTVDFARRLVTAIETARSTGDRR